MIVTKTYASKSNTIVRDSAANLGLNPLLEIQYGRILSRGMIYFNHSKVMSLVKDGTYPDTSKLHHVLKMTNTASIDDSQLNCGIMERTVSGEKDRAASFDLVFFLIPNDWDNGKGYSYAHDLYGTPHAAPSTDGSNWYKCRNFFKWEEDGIYSTDRLHNEQDLMTMAQGNMSSVMFGWQHFDYGNEDIELDVTCIFNKFINGELENYGFGIAFAPSYEDVETPRSQYVAFFTQHTNSFYEPYIETTYGETIEDDRMDFHLDKDNKLYFYSTVGGQYANLDSLPKCTLDDSELTVRQVTKGIYCAEVKLSSDKYEVDTMYYDVWSGISYGGKEFGPVELSFVTKASDGYFSFGLPASGGSSDEGCTITAYGIDSREKVKRGDVRKVVVECTVPYTSGTVADVSGVDYRLYVNEGGKQRDVIGWTKVERGYGEYFLLLATEDLIPWRYHLDVRVTQGQELRHTENVIEFDIVDDVTETYK